MAEFISKKAFSATLSPFLKYFVFQKHNVLHTFIIGTLNKQQLAGLGVWRKKTPYDQGTFSVVADSTIYELNKVNLSISNRSNRK